MAATTFQSEETGVTKSPTTSPTQSVSPRWSSIVKGPTVMVSDSVSVSSSSSSAAVVVVVEDQTENLISDDSGADDTNGGGKKPVWNKRVNGVSDAVSPVMDAVSWPALGEFSKSSPKKSSSSESLKGLADVPALQVVTENSSSSPRKATAGNSKTPTSTHGKQRSVKRGGGSFNKNVSLTSAISQDLVMENENVGNVSGKPVAGGGGGGGGVEGSVRENAHVESVKGGLGSQSNNDNERQHQRNTYRRSNSGPHSRGDGSYHHGYGGKRDQDREWNQHSRSFNGRDAHGHSQRGYPRGGYVRPAVHTPPPFIPPQMPLLRPFGNNMMYPDLPSPPFYVQGPPPPPEVLRGMAPLVGPPIPPPMYFVQDPMLYARIVAQIDYYFSNDNLVKDIYLRKNMDEQGWVPVSLIANFKKVLYLTDNIQLILDAMRASTNVEVQGDKIRRRSDWMRWLMQPPAQAGGNQDVLASHLQGVSLDDAASTVQNSVQSCDD